MDKKYIIKNCPAFCNDICGDDRKECFCDEVTDCVLKQIVEKCRDYYNMQAITTEDYARREVALKILDLLDIQEVE